MFEVGLTELLLLALVFAVVVVPPTALVLWIVLRKKRP